MQATSELVRAAIQHVQEAYPFWNASDGADHFMVFSYDHGAALAVEPTSGMSVHEETKLISETPVLHAAMHARSGRACVRHAACPGAAGMARQQALMHVAAGKCEMAGALQLEDFGRMFSVQAYGSLVYRCLAGLAPAACMAVSLVGCATGACGTGCRLCHLDLQMNSLPSRLMACCQIVIRMLPVCRPWHTLSVSLPALFPVQQIPCDEDHIPACGPPGRSDAKVQAVDRGDSYDWAGPTTWACYRQWHLAVTDTLFRLPCS